MTAARDSSAIRRARGDTMSRTTTRIARSVAGALMLLVVPARGHADMRQDCVAQGGTYFEDGHCEVGRDEQRKKCIRQGGHFLSNGSCEIRRDPVEECKKAGGDGMSDGRCWRIVRPEDER
jgi:hypothetical protein